ncbi:MAG: flagellar brake protein [Gammaproteobacteria bacterium]|nr:flagellar brake protein [Gammaproteobacteria bacterium]MBU1775055.1 flagellar brake protein [Gammaproteobacteria bacterium]MBU1969155.1 flagellar brake protein [Gammaproteobacteria bacterium]
MTPHHHHIDDSEFAIHNRKEIIFILEDLVRHGVMVNLAAHGDVHLVTTVLGVNPEANQVYIDVCGDNRLNQKIAESDYVSFVTQDGVKVRWHSTHLRLIPMTDGGDSFAMLIPSVIERVQRRQYFRLTTPQGSRALICKIPAGAEIIEANIHDMSVGGIGVSFRGVLHEIFSQGAILEGCSIEFPQVGVVPMSLRVCGKWVSTATRSGEQVHRIGLEFVDLSRGAGNVLQRYMIQLEAEKISLT